LHVVLPAFAAHLRLAAEDEPVLVEIVIVAIEAAAVSQDAEDSSAGDLTPRRPVAAVQRFLTGANDRHRNLPGNAASVRERTVDETLSDDRRGWHGGAWDPPYLSSIPGSRPDCWPRGRSARRACRKRCLPRARARALLPRYGGRV